MSVTQIDIDDEALSEAMRLMGTTTKKDSETGSWLAWRTFPVLTAVPCPPLPVHPRPDHR